VLRKKCVTRRQGSSVHPHECYSFGTSRLLSDTFIVWSLHENSTRKYWFGSYRPRAECYTCTTVLCASIYKVFLFSYKVEVVKEFSKLFHINVQLLSLLFRLLLAKVCKKRTRVFITENRGLSAILHQPGLWQWTITSISRDVSTINSHPQKSQ
jgi:hypothetical protein